MPRLWPALRRRFSGKPTSWPPWPGTPSTLTVFWIRWHPAGLHAIPARTRALGSRATTSPRGSYWPIRPVSHRSSRSICLCPHSPPHYFARAVGTRYEPPTTPAEALTRRSRTFHPRAQPGGVSVTPCNTRSHICGRSCAMRMMRVSYVSASTGSTRRAPIAASYRRERCLGERAAAATIDRPHQPRRLARPMHPASDRLLRAAPERGRRAAP